MNKTGYKLVLLLAVFIAGHSLCQDKADSLYNAAILQVYDNPDSAIQLANELYDLGSSEKKHQAMAMVLISTAYSSKRDFQKSLAYALKAKDLNKSIKDPLLQVQILSKLASQYQQLGVNDKALEILDEADVIANQIESNDSVRSIVGNNYAIKGFIYTNQLSCDVAVSYFEKAIQVYSTVNETARILANKSVITYNIGNCMISLNRLHDAEEKFKNAEVFAERAGANSLQAFSLKGLAEVYTLEGKNMEALEKLKKAETLAKDVGDLVLNREIYKGMADNYLALNDWDNYLKQNDKQISFSQQIVTAERQTINNLLTNYAQELESKESKIRWYYGGAIILLLLSIFSLLYFFLKNEIKFRNQLKILKSQVKF